MSFVIAGKPAPTGIKVVTNIVADLNPVGAGLPAMASAQTTLA
ncbi:hypothetical protein [Pseudomonas sp. TWP3-1]